LFGWAKERSKKTSAAPIILTGYQALNKLMGVAVYSTNEQIGGPGVMYLKGISHKVAPDHLLAVKAAVDWLSYVPSSPRAFLPITDVRGIEWEVAFKPTMTKAVSSGCLVERAEMQKGETRKEPIPTSIERTGVCVLLESIKSLDSIMPSVLASMS
jgi:hypothetical protein